MQNVPLPRRLRLTFFTFFTRVRHGTNPKLGSKNKCFQRVQGIPSWVPLSRPSFGTLLGLSTRGVTGDGGIRDPLPCTPHSSRCVKCVTCYGYLFRPPKCMKLGSPKSSIFDPFFMVLEVLPISAQPGKTVFAKLANHQMQNVPLPCHCPSCFLHVFAPLF